MSDSLLTTSQAAQLLNVSEASVRRWGDAGLLPVKRLGRRRARRFAEKDVLRFRDRDQAGRSRPSERRPRPEAHRHYATFYESDDDRLRVTAPFLAEGLLAGEPCFLVADSPVLDHYVGALEDLAPGAIDAATKQGRFSVIRGVGPRARDALAVWDDAFTRAVGLGATMLRVVGEMAVERKAFRDDEEMIDYEFGFNAISLRFPTVTYCQYDVREFDGKVILGALKAHPDVIGSRLGEALL
jgi:excisionase family DNA binding protein